MVFAFQKKMFISEGGVANTSSPFYGAEYLNFQLYSSFIRSVLSLFFSPINHLLSGVRSVCLRADFYATNICIRWRPSPDIFHSLAFYIFSIFAGIEFKVSLLISLLYTPNKVLFSFCWNLQLTRVHCHRRNVTCGCVRISSSISKLNQT